MFEAVFARAVEVRDAMRSATVGAAE